MIERKDLSRGDLTVAALSIPMDAVQAHSDICNPTVRAEMPTSTKDMQGLNTDSMMRGKDFKVGDR